MLEFASEKERKLLESLRGEKSALQREYDLLSHLVKDLLRVSSEKEADIRRFKAEKADESRKHDQERAYIASVENELLEKRSTASELDMKIAEADRKLKASEADFAVLNTKLVKIKNEIHDSEKEYGKINKKLLDSWVEFDRRESKVKKEILEASEITYTSMEHHLASDAYRHELHKYKEALDTYRKRVLMDIKDAKEYWIEVDKEIPTFEEFSKINKHG